tara:strand:- start:274 stop:900 length:627 start_codon:yes stop_codon:yes gene_type:complete
MISELNEQENFWKNEFGNEYSSRNNNTDESLEQRTSEFLKYLKSTHEIKSVLEFGANIGLNLSILKSLLKEPSLHAVEINSAAIEELSSIVPRQNIFEGSFNEFISDQKFDLVLSRGVLIHLNPNELEKAYEQLYKYSKRYILISEYFNAEPVNIDYRGYKNKLFKRDFCKEILQSYNDLKLVDYGFLYSSDNKFNYDDLTWFLMEKG